MNKLYYVRLRSNMDYIYGPFDDEPLAQRFAEFLTDEVDPAVVFELRSPVLEMLNWRRSRSLDKPLDKPAG